MTALPIGAIAQKYLTLLVSLGAIAATPSLMNSPAKTLLFLAGLASSSVGLISHRQIKREMELYSDYRLIDRELRLSHPFAPAIAPTATESGELQIKEPPKEWFKNLILKSYHYRVNGETGSGKSTLAENLISLAQKSLGEGTEVILNDPKYPLSEWAMEPMFKGIGEALAGLELVATTIENRLSEARKIKDSGGTIPKFSPILFVVDEIDWIVSEYGKDATKLLKVGLKVGRALNVKILYLGQSPLCTDLGMRKNDFRNSANFYLGENIPPSIDKEACHTLTEKRFWAEQYTARVARGDDYLALIKPMGKPCFIATLPSPKLSETATPKPAPTPSQGTPQGTPQPATGISQPQESQDAVEWLKRCHSLPCDDSPQPQPQAKPPVSCPHCESQDYGSNGSYQGRKRAKCKGCQKSFYLD